MKKIITISLLALFLCFTMPMNAMVPMQEAAPEQKTESQKVSAESTSKEVPSQSQSKSKQDTTVKKSTTHEITRGKNTTKAEERIEKSTTVRITSTEPSTTTQSTSANNSVLFGKNKMLSIAAWTLIGIGVLFVLIVVIGGKSRRHRKPFQKSTKRYKNRSKYNNYSDRYRSNIKRK